MVHFSCQRFLQITTCKLKTIPKNLKGKDKVSQKWLERQLSDPYVIKARDNSYRCRSAFKLLEIDDKFHLLRPGQIIVDCGAAPGSWTQVAVARTNALGSDLLAPIGKVIAVDLQHIMPIPGAILLSKSDFTSLETTLDIHKILSGQKVDAVVSDMAPNATGIKHMDHEIIVDLCIKALTFSVTVLNNGGTFLCKIWQGSMQKKLETLLKEGFQSVKLYKPSSSRTDSAEAFLLARNFNPKHNNLK